MPSTARHHRSRPHQDPDLPDTASKTIQGVAKTGIRGISAALVRAAVDVTIAVFVEGYWAKRPQAAMRSTRVSDRQFALLAERFYQPWASDPIELVFSVARHRTARTEPCPAIRHRRPIVSELAMATAEAGRRMEICWPTGAGTVFEGMAEVASGRS